METRHPDAMALRLAVGVAVPALGVGAHGAAAGTLPTVGGVLLAAGIGALAAMVVPAGRAGMARTAATVIGILTLAQIASHGVLSLDGHRHVMAAGSGSELPMALTHLVAVPVSAVLIAVAVLLADAITSTVRRVLGRSSGTVADRPHPIAHALVLGRPVAVLVGGTGLRGPPHLR